MATMVGVMVPTFNPSIWESGVGRPATKAWATSTLPLKIIRQPGGVAHAFNRSAWKTEQVGWFLSLYPASSETARTS